MKSQVVVHEVNDSALEPILEAIRRGPLSVLTGAGVSTDSGIPDYRGEGSPPRHPMNVQQFLTDERYRKRYWAGSHRGWKTFTSTQPNAGHRALARLEEIGAVNGVITQNVDGLHIHAGSKRVVDVHGSMSRVRCLDCGQYFSRAAIEEQLVELNPHLDDPGFVTMSPDGDAEVNDIEGFQIPSCTVCGGMLKPDVVYFGELVPVTRFASAQAIVAESSGLLILGSSLAVNTGIRLLEQARREGKPIFIVNRGATKGDSRAMVRIHAGTSEFLEALLAQVEGAPVAV
ncbi:Sir2 family NAD-dependent protein deacetylase [Lysinibacter cavernae]|uniref:protein acetyllysine N-acetyltransferase n=1 Tax=Lysinibacter cavernae TaxID=1640652 RepID=A0A7X5QZE2_9MICO|nr:NAD-dependent SIR2 family protein deacetylase [Lysinibacter cavernae]